jgi:hypothetical protein
MPPNWICEVLERRRTEGGGSDEVLYPSQRRSEGEQPNSRMKVKVEQLSSGCRLYVPRDWGRRGSKRSGVRPGTPSIYQFAKRGSGQFSPACR